jgi:hypothetical protein
MSPFLHTGRVPVYNIRPYTAIRHKRKQQLNFLILQVTKSSINSQFLILNSVLLNDSVEKRTLYFTAVQQHIDVPDNVCVCVCAEIY